MAKAGREKKLLVVVQSSDQRPEPEGLMTKE
ncbi:hypothetical protein CCACVL1_21218 [Corchorus capsularis]|uniref:Uncharacterized protein n=1 Tax=Corchorus capsularis TaxID=210143 RepID=A0A1R3H7L2_COCAP|nr:hypothetical protein CCACVL1_21218 [Corchorus capsularis]